MQKITPFLWLSDNAEEAVRFLRLHFQKFQDWENRTL